MRPAYSIIFFTVFSGAGLGLLGLTSLFSTLNLIPPTAAVLIGATGLALVMTSGGLAASALHLGRPERMLLALTQWRSSWLSREAVLALLTYLAAGSWLVAGHLDAVVIDGRLVGGGALVATSVLTALLALATVACTAMIYGSLKPVHQWRGAWVVPIYLVLGLASGAAWLNGIVALAEGANTAAAWLALAALVLGAVLKLGYWRFVDTTSAASTAASATGLGGLGKVRLLDPPHSEENYLQQEMAFRIARKHAAKLRRLALLLGFVLPFALIALAALAAGVAAAVPALLAPLVMTAGLLLERWLFFAEAKHTVTLYYGAHQA